MYVRTDQFVFAANVSSKKTREVHIHMAIPNNFGKQVHKFQTFCFSQGNLKGESVAVAILPSHVLLYLQICLQLNKPSNFIKNALPFLHH